MLFSRIADEKKKQTTPSKFFIQKGLKIITVVPLGFEPKQTEPESDVLPLHHGTIAVQIYNQSEYLKPNLSKNYSLSFPAILDQLSLRVTVRLNTSLPDCESESTQKYPIRSN